MCAKGQFRCHIIRTGMLNDNDETHHYARQSYYIATSVVACTQASTAAMQCHVTGTQSGHPVLLGSTPVPPAITTLPCAIVTVGSGTAVAHFKPIKTDSSDRLLLRRT